MRDSDVREALRARLTKEHAGAKDTRLVEEMGIWSGAVRVDVAVINGELRGYELKSDSDTLERLPNQAAMYGKVFDRMTLVVGRKHMERALAIVPRWWGCLEARVGADGVVLKHKRKARVNPELDAKIIAQLLWKEEALAVLDFHGLARGWRACRSAEILNRIIDHVPLDVLTAHVRAALKARASLGQRVSCDLNMPIEVQTDPNTRIADRKRRIGNHGVDLSVGPAVPQRMSRAQADYLLGIAPELLVHGHGAWTFDLDASEHHEAFGHSVLRVDRNECLDLNGRSGGNAAVVAEVQPVRQRMGCKSSPKKQLVSRQRRLTKAESGECRGYRAANKRDRSPGSTAVKRRKSIRNRDSKRGDVRNTPRKVDNNVGV